jgi:aspartate aminotransferase/aminotransferase
VNDVLVTFETEAMPNYSAHVSRSGEAISIKYNNLVYDLKRAGKKVIVLSLGEAYFDIPLWSMADLPFPDLYHYSHSRGIPELRQKLASYYEARYQVEVDPAQELLVTAGSKAAIFLSLLCILNPGDEVIIHEPAWVSYHEQVRLCHGVPVFVPCQQTVFDYERYVTDRTRVIILNNPHNPTGKVYTRPELQYMFDLAKINDLYLIADEAYSDFAVRQPHQSMGTFDPQKKHVILVNSISKNFGISGWRLGYVIANRGLIQQVLKPNQHIITCPATILAHYVTRHFDEILSITKPQIEVIDRKRQEISNSMRRLGLTCLPGSATFYFFVSIAPSKLTSDEFCTRLLADEQICAVPGIGYGDSCDGYIRISIGTESVPDICYALGRIKRLIDITAAPGEMLTHEAA